MNDLECLSHDKERIKQRNCNAGNNHEKPTSP